jgi:membrane protease YdiL (CAAX protease family)
MTSVRASAFAAFVAPACARPALWRLLLGLLLSALLWTGAALGLLRAGQALGLGAAGVLLLYLASFAGLGLGTALAARLLHQRAPATLIGPGGFRVRALLGGAAAVAALGLVTTAATFALAPPLRQTGLGDWARLLPLALALVLVQSAAEELLFRGYLMQGLAARFRSPLMWAFLPALAFGLLHWDAATYGADAWLAVAAATAIGLAFADVTAVTGNLSAAIGLHFANNVLALLLVAVPGETAALALFVSPVDAAHPMRAWLLADIALTALVWGTWRLVLALPGRRLHSRDRGSI